MMTPVQKDIVQKTWQQVVPIADQAAAMFYDRLFEIDPTVRALFVSTDMVAQREKLVAMLGTAVLNLDKLETVLPAVEALGRRHVAYGVTDSHYESVGAALLWTLEQGLGEAWSADAAAAWGTAYAVLSGVMRSAAAAEKAAA
jgi:hemoglobin-like flavoprotein